MTIGLPMKWKSLAAGFNGHVITPDSAEYDNARAVWNSWFDRRPLAVLRPAAVEDVATAVRFAREENLPVAVRSGGHSYGGHSTCDDGVVVDLSLLRSVEMNPDRGTIRTGAGVLLGEVDRATVGYGQVVPAGIVSHTGLAGLALGGGIGYLTRALGLTCDQFITLEVVTADGDVVHASEDENPELLWALRGGGGNFGIVTEFELRTQALGEFRAGHMFYRMRDTDTAFPALAEIVERGDRDLSIQLIFGVEPSFIGLDGREPLAVAIVFYRGTEEDEALREVRAVGEPILDTIGRVSFIDWQRQNDVRSGYGTSWHMKGRHALKLSGDLIQMMSEAALAYRDVVPPELLGMGVFGFVPIGGAAGDVSEDESAYSGRSAEWHTAIELGCRSRTDGERISDWLRERWAEIEPTHDLTTSYVNMRVDEGVESLEDVYGVAKHERLRYVKAQYDPTNFFHLNSNIAPAVQKV